MSSAWPSRRPGLCRSALRRVRLRDELSRSIRLVGATPHPAPDGPSAQANARATQTGSTDCNLFHVSPFHRVIAEPLENGRLDGSHSGSAAGSRPIADQSSCSPSCASKVRKRSRNRLPSGIGTRRFSAAARTTEYPSVPREQQMLPAQTVR